MADRPLAETQLDDAIDRAVREMMNVEPRGDLRARVLAELGGPPARAALWPRLAFATVALVATVAVLTTTVRRPSDHPHVPRVATSQPSTTPALEPVLPPPPSNDVTSPAPRTGTTPSKGRDSRHSNTGSAERLPAGANRLIQAASIDTIDATHGEPVRPIDPIGVANLRPISQPEIVITPITVEQIAITPLSSRR